MSAFRPEDIFRCLTYDPLLSGFYTNNKEDKVPCPWKEATEEEKDAIIADYLVGSSPEKACKKFGYSHTVLYKALKDRGISTRWRGKNRKHGVCADFFDVIDNEEKAYWLGFITADGSVSPKGVLSIKLSRLDKPHLEKLRTALSYEGEIQDSMTEAWGWVYPNSRLAITHTGLVQALNRLGVIPNKSTRETPCTEVPQDLMFHYWRGMFDGDGHISPGKTEKGKPHWEIGLTGSDEIVTAFRDFIVPGKVTPSVRPNGSIFRVAFHGTASSQAAIRKLYTGASLYLDRKYNLVQELLSLPIILQDRSHHTKEELLQLYSELGTWKAVAAHLGTSSSQMSKLSDRLRLR